MLHWSEIPDYWGHDERYPQNKLPYADAIKYLIIPDISDALAAMRAGKIDVMNGVLAADALAMQKTNPEILHDTDAAAAGSDIAAGQ